MKAVANASPIIFLSKLEGLRLLPECLGEISIPRAVQRELGRLPLIPEIRIRPVSPLGAQFVAGASGRLHPGELEAMVLARELQADFVVLDDFLARQKAKRLGIPVIGTLGVIVLAHRQGRISEATALEWLDALVHHHGMYVSADMLDRVKRAMAHRESRYRESREANTLSPSPASGTNPSGTDLVGRSPPGGFRAGSPGNIGTG